MYILNLDAETNRILSAAIMPHPPIDAVLVYVLPDGDITDYLYANGEYVYDPLPEPEPVAEEPSQLDIIEAQVTYTAMMTDTLLEV